ncbi:DUF58 domain-containing protein [Wenxinia saemankumensis]|uniref:DUF58 domain-containing protein n=1 Tax=Wenxinia saemankumensis TaxID=1447782 RepID=A0A1M6C177_9RHOB|nr:DUF58 domain-containing protein [Wenxinia saemankumensis]SHI54484.1 Protein of unknown function DUF58 [Wenxinia saemankumensis]
MSEAAALSLRAGAEALAAPLPPLMAEASELAATVLLGEHGRRRPGTGDDFWQYRPAGPGDPARRIDWRRSARGDTPFVQDKEWQTAQSVMLWVDAAASMGFASAGQPAKADRARLLGLAAAILLVRAGERVGLASAELPPGAGRPALERIAARLGESHEGEHGAPDLSLAPPYGRALLISDFLGPLDAVEAALAQATDRHVRGVLLMVLDPEEEAFPFSGRTIFESMAGTQRHETLQAGDLRGRYLARLAERKARLQDLAALSGWQVSIHHTDRSAAQALLWIHQALGRRA